LVDFANTSHFSDCGGQNQEAMSTREVFLWSMNAYDA
jgi:hypothetical protein